MTRLRHVTAAEKIRKRLEENERAKRSPANVTQLAKAMKRPREAVSRRVNGAPMTADYAADFETALGFKSGELRPPKVEVVSLESLDRRLQSLEEKVEKMIDLTEEALRLLRAARKRGTQAA